MATEHDEIEAVINRIIELKNESKEITWNDFAILIRTNSMAEGYIAGLNNAGIPHIFLSARGLYNKPIILDIIAYLKLCDNYHESRALFRMLNWKYMILIRGQLLKLITWPEKTLINV